MNFRIENSQLAVFFPKIPNIRRMVFDLEELLNNRFVTPFTMIQVPDEAPEEIPRIQAASINNHTHLSVAQSNISLITNFDNGWESDWKKCFEYLHGNQSLLFKIADHLSQNSFLYCGLTVTLFFPFPNQKSVMEHINKVLFPEKKFDNLHEFNFRFVHKLNNEFFINYAYSSTIKYLLDSSVMNPIPAYLTPIEYGLTINIDINDRFGSNFIRGYRSNIETSIKLLEYMDNVISNKLDSLFNKGEA